MTLNAKYPNLSGWLQDGWIEIGRSYSGDAYAKAFDCGGMICEIRRKPKTLEATLQALDEEIAKWIEEH